MHRVMLTARAIFSRYPALQQQLPFVSLGTLPTPVQPLPDQAGELRLKSLWIKRDDLSAQDYGGNKVRKLEFLLADAQQRGCSQVITYGGLGSNHVLATAINCKRLGLNCSALLTPEPVTRAVRQRLRHHLELGTRLHYETDMARLNTSTQRLLDEYGEDNCYIIPFGGSSWLGSIGFVDAALELANQVASGEMPQPDVIYMACGTAGSTAGLALGLQLARLATRIQAVQVTPLSFKLEEINQRLYRQTLGELQTRDKSVPTCEFSESGLVVRTDQLGEGYAIPTESGREAAEWLQATASLPASLTYTAKALAALLDDARRGFLAGRNVLFWNTYNSHPLPSFPEDDSRHQLPKSLQRLFTALEQ